MKLPFTFENWLDTNGAPAGGVAFGHGFCISWQNGPLGRGNERKEPNGAFVETIIDAARQRLVHYQKTKFSCPENETALMHLNSALASLNSRTANREARQVEGTHGI